MENPKEPVPQMLQHLETQLREHCQEYVLIALHNGQYWRSFSSETSAFGMMNMQMGDLEASWEHERHNEFHQEDEDHD